MERAAALTRARGVAGSALSARAGAAFVALAVLAGAAGAAGTARAGAAWSRPVQVSPPTSISILGPQVAVSITGAGAVSFNEVNLDSQSMASAFLAVSRPHGAFSAARAVPGAQEILDIAYSGSTLELLTASAPAGQPCCTTVQALRRSAGGRFGHRQTLVTNVGGGATGQLVPLSNGHMLAVIAGPQRLWAAEASAGGHFDEVRGLTPAGSAPAAVAAAGTPDGGSAVAWTRGSAASVSVARAGPGGTPSRSRTVVTLPYGHTIDGLQLAPRPDGLTVGWTESWNDSAGTYHARAMAADVGGGARSSQARALSAAGDVASGLVLAAAGSSGAEVAAWDVCAPSSGACVLQGRARTGETSTKGKSKRRPKASWFGRALHLGEIDPGESAQLAIAPAGASLLGWITGGRVALAAKSAGAGRFGRARRVPGGLADDVEVGFGPTGKAVAAWTEGSAAPGVFVSVGG